MWSWERAAAALWSISGGPLLHVLDHATDLLVVGHFYLAGLYGYMALSAIILFGYALASSFIASSDSPLRPVAGDL